MIGVGAGGHARVVVDAIQARGSDEIVGLLDQTEALWGSVVLGIPVLGDDSMLPALFQRGITQAFVGVGSVGDVSARRGVFSLLRRTGFRVINVVHPAAVVSPHARSGEGLTACACAIINAGAILGENVLVNSAAVVEHDCHIGDHVHIATGARLSGGVTVGDGSHIGAGATVRQGVRIGRGSTIGAGAVVINDVPDFVIVAGVPARLLRKVE